ncbi:MAG: 50S ribosomal protein L35ae [Candidatus Bathyarchaeota archaeon]|nr:50S ribosomal protein L35ae [Candidatus Bathyarchaeota archaeon]
MKIIGRITNYRTGPKSQQPKECLIQFDNMDFGSAGKLVGQKVVWTKGKDEWKGKIVGTHGRTGTVRAKFARPVPGQAIGTIVELVS